MAICLKISYVEQVAVEPSKTKPGLQEVMENTCRETPEELSWTPSNPVRECLRSGKLHFLAICVSFGFDPSLDMSVHKLYFHTGSSSWFPIVPCFIIYIYCVRHELGVLLPLSFQFN
ncbi:hypothetical protein AMECASPLE_026742 [Ameca splendens]|uniref:Uncharacterized protein n=1 Tax=Ameca splendens TaxID=208324 RepID=A0ABV0YSE6_9TELE